MDEAIELYTTSIFNTSRLLGTIADVEPSAKFTVAFFSAILYGIFEQSNGWSKKATVHTRLPDGANG